MREEVADLLGNREDEIYVYVHATKEPEIFHGAGMVDKGKDHIVEVRQNDNREIF